MQRLTLLLKLAVQLGLIQPEAVAQITREFRRAAENPNAVSYPLFEKWAHEYGVFEPADIDRLVSTFKTLRLMCAGCGAASVGGQYLTMVDLRCPRCGNPELRTAEQTSGQRGPLAVTTTALTPAPPPPLPMSVAGLPPRKPVVEPGFELPPVTFEGAQPPPTTAWPEETQVGASIMDLVDTKSPAPPVATTIATRTQPPPPSVNLSVVRTQIDSNDINTVAARPGMSVNIAPVASHGHETEPNALTDLANVGDTDDFDLRDLELEIESLCRQGAVIQAVDKLRPRVSKPNPSPVLEALMTKTRALRDAVEAKRTAIEQAMHAKEIPRVRAELAKLLELTPLDPTGQLLLLELERKELRKQLDVLVNVAQGAVSRFNLPGAKRLIAQADLLAGDEPDAIAQVDHVRSRLRRQTLVLASVASAALVIVAVIVVLIASANTRQAQIEAAEQAADATERLRLLQHAAQQHPNDQDLLARIDAARKAAREQKRKQALGWPDPQRRVEALQDFLREYPNDPVATAGLEAARTAMINEMRLATERRKLSQALAVPDLAAKIKALEAFIAEHPDPGLAEQASAGIQAAVLEQTTQHLAKREGLADPWERWTELLKYSPPTDYSGPAWTDMAQRLEQARDRAKAAVVNVLLQESRLMNSSEAAKRLMEQCTRAETIAPDLIPSLRPLRDRAEQIVAEDAEGDKLSAEAGQLMQWYQATDYLKKVNEFLARVPRLRQRMAAAVAMGEQLASEQPPVVEGFTWLRSERFDAARSGPRVHVYRCEAFAKALKLAAVPEELPERAVSAGGFTRVDVEFVLLPPIGMAKAEFLAGAPEDEAQRTANEAQHWVELTKPYLLARTELTQELWKALAGLAELPMPVVPQSGANLPIVSVTWEQAVKFCQALNLRLPTEAEWEFACRAGTTTPFAFGATVTPNEVNYDGTRPYGDTRPGLNRRASVPVATFACNAFGFHEMHGNVWEWCGDWFSRFEDNVKLVDPHGPATGMARVLRGGSWRMAAAQSRSANRNGAAPTGAASDIGLRPAKSVR